MSAAFTEDEVMSMKESIFVLMTGAGQEGIESFQKPTMGIREILAAFSVGTENRKKMAVGPPDP